jgi:hypothetical protein
VFQTVLLTKTVHLGTFATSCVVGEISKNGRCPLIAGHNEIHILLKLKDAKREQKRLDQ